MKISYVSDLHLEFKKYYNFRNEPGGDILLLCGDILVGAYLRSNRTDQDTKALKRYLDTQIRELCSKYKHVYYIFGNHEYYHSDYHELKEIVRQGLHDLGLPIKIFDNDYVVHGDYVLFGAPLWTDYNRWNPLVVNEIMRGMNDYRYIGSGTPELFYVEHLNTIDNIKKLCSKFSDKKIIIFTHMAPMMQSVNVDHSGNYLDYAYASNLYDIIFQNPNIMYWIHGHVHSNFDYMVEQCRILSNCHGYMHESCFRTFDGLKHIEV